MRLVALFQSHVHRRVGRVKTNRNNDTWDRRQRHGDAHWFLLHVKDYNRRKVSSNSSTSRLHFTSNTQPFGNFVVYDLLNESFLFQLHEVQDYCSEFLRSQLDPSNCLGIRAFADTHSCRELLKIADKYMQNNFIDVVESDEFMQLPIGQLIEMISNDELNVKHEEQVFQAVMSWIRQNVNERKQHLGQLLCHVRLPLLDTKFLVTKVGNDALIKQDQVCRDLIDEAKDYHLLPMDRSLMQGPRTKPRKPFLLTEVLFAVGGWCSGDAISSVEMYDPAQSPSNGEWKIVTSMSKRRCGVGVGVLNISGKDYIYAIGKLLSCSVPLSCWQYFLVTQKWPTNLFFRFRSKS